MKQEIKQEAKRTLEPIAVTVEELTMIEHFSTSIKNHCKQAGVDKTIFIAILTGRIAIKIKQ